MTDAVQHLETAYRDVAARMEGLPVFNPRLTVEAVGFREWEAGRCIGVLVTPWFMNLVLLPAPGDDWEALKAGSEQHWELPDGEYTFSVARTDDVPLHQSCPLFSSVTEFPDMETARQVAHEVMTALFTPGRGGTGDDGERPPQETGVRTPLTRRDLLRRAVGGSHEDKA